MKLLQVALLVFAMCGCASLAHADSLTAFGVPVTGAGSNTQAVPDCPTLEGLSCFNPTTGAIKFFIPLSLANSGIFGVTPVSGGTAGTISDTGGGAASTLTMYLRFTPVAVPASSGTLTSHFVDLDLAGVNDPTSFFEAVQFFSANGTALTPLITANGQAGGGALTFVVSGNSTSQVIFFPDVTTIVQNPFYVRLDFGSQYNSTGRNTPESLSATLTTTPVPEPGTLVLVGSGLLGFGLTRRSRSRRAARPAGRGELHPTTR